jgi:cbb3-type cytochrome oxidase subunit 3
MTVTLENIIYGGVIGIVLVGLVIWSYIRGQKKKNNNNNHNLPM